ncbi:hypothetical protein [Mesorhizobium sp. B2-6-2]|uniref:hypothetical protein n=1 Tax=Mesorhizobium sp. B2-6-2 TaxID=2589915 RepID=UPI00112C8BD9|nr:hypothetical protein [Mesorhizobium sp. B2-6-2]TPJ79983.1 hypothetical protein FJ419_08590 [Mesorhizobium sp. B2-6-2]
MYLKYLISAAILVAAASPAVSQDQYVRPLRPGEDGSARIQSSISMTFPVKDDDDAAAQQQVALRSRTAEISAGTAEIPNWKRCAMSV